MSEEKPEKPEPLKDSLTQDCLKKEEPELNWFDLLAIFAFCWVVSQYF